MATDFDVIVIGSGFGGAVVAGRLAEAGYKNLYVADGAIIPTAIGNNPSRTIAALAERIARLMIDEGR